MNFHAKFWGRHFAKKDLCLLATADELFKNISSGVGKPGPGEDVRAYAPAMSGTGQVHLSGRTSTVKYEGMGQIVSGIISSKKF